MSDIAQRITDDIWRMFLIFVLLFALVNACSYLVDNGWMDPDGMPEQMLEGFIFHETGVDMDFSD